MSFPVSARRSAWSLLRRSSGRGWAPLSPAWGHSVSPVPKVTSLKSNAPETRSPLSSSSPWKSSRLARAVPAPNANTPTRAVSATRAPKLPLIPHSPFHACPCARGGEYKYVLARAQPRRYDPRVSRLTLSLVASLVVGLVALPTGAAGTQRAKVRIMTLSPLVVHGTGFRTHEH